MKRASIFLAAYILAFVAASLIPTFVHRLDFDRAFFAYYRNPTPENAAAFQAQRRINNYINTGISAVAAFLLVSFGYGTYVAIRFVGLKRISRPDSQP